MIYCIIILCLNRGVSYIDSPEWLKNKEAAISPKSNENNCFQYALTSALNFEKIKSQPERIFNLEPFINKYGWKEIALTILFGPYNTEKKRLA